VRRPSGQLVGILDRALPEPEVRADLRTVPLGRSASPFVQTKIRGRHLHRSGDDPDRLVRQFAATAGETAMPDVELHQRYEAAVPERWLVLGLLRLVNSPACLLNNGSRNRCGVDDAGTRAGDRASNLVRIAA
jgi:hypothetical protein